MQPKFIHLQVHSEYSISDGIVRIEPLLKACIEHKFPAIAITDRCNLFALVKFYQAAQLAGIKPIVGVDISIAESNNRTSIVTLLAQNIQGYRNIMQLVSRAYIEGQRGGVPIVDKVWLSSLAEGVIALSGESTSDIGRALTRNDISTAKRYLTWWQEHFKNRFYLQLQRLGKPREEVYIHTVLDFAQHNNIPVVATNAVRFLKKSDFDAHEARVCIHDGVTLEDPHRPRIYTEQQYLRSQEEMVRLFSDIPEALQNTVEIAKRCNLILEFGKVFLPQFPVPSSMTIEQFLNLEAKRGLEARLINKKNLQLQYLKRLDYELNIINQMGFAGYFLIVADFIHWAKENDIPVGPGRGSGAGSLVAYALKITDLDPIEHDLLFERFLNPERVSLPDFDIDFCIKGRDRVIDYVIERYGRENVAQIITYGTMAARAVIRDIGRVLAHSYGYVDKLAKLIPFELGITLQKALDEGGLLAERYQAEEEVKALIDLAMKLEGLTRNAGKHAGGVVIAPSALTNFTPLYCEEGSKSLVTQFDKGDVEAIGLVKFDFLGLRTLTIIDWAVKTINAKLKLGKEPIDITKIPLNDKATFDLLKSCATTAVFQLESRGMRDLIKRLQPDCFADIVALVALFRPGPLQSGMVDDFVERKHGRAVVRYPHPALEQILHATYGVILYQEQVMQIAQVLAGYSLGSADLLRRAMGKKKPEEMAKHRAIFIEGAIKCKVDKHIANHIFDLMEKFAGYGFNKSHSVGYALIAYQTAWLKAHFPAEFMAAVLSSDMDNTDKVANFINECKQMRLNVIPPDINNSQYKFTVDETHNIIYGLGAIKGVGLAAIEEIISNRNESGSFKNLFDLCNKVATRKINKKVLESLIKAGALDSFNVDRASQFNSIQLALQAAEQNAKNHAKQQADLFSELQFESPMQELQYVISKKWDMEEYLRNEYEALGLFLSGHPIVKYEAELAHFITAPIGQLDVIGNKNVVVAGQLVAIKSVQTKSGRRMAVITLEDRSGRMSVTVFADAYREYRDLLIAGRLIVVAGDLAYDGFSGSYRVQARNIMNISGAREEYAKYLQLTISEQQMQGGFVDKLTNILVPFKGGKCAVVISYFCQGAKSKLLLGGEWKIKLTEELLSLLNNFLGEENVKIIYN